jgi:hypothetical protein
MQYSDFAIRRRHHRPRRHHHHHHHCSSKSIHLHHDNVREKNEFLLRCYV